ncbi:MAG: hypothetical protein HW399_1153 [Dehalococcoidia bacterium]|nr:hypothetical protein [Dehalococcoidia bacterium]
MINLEITPNNCLSLDGRVKVRVTIIKILKYTYL